MQITSCTRVKVDSLLRVRKPLISNFFSKDKDLFSHYV